MSPRCAGPRRALFLDRDGVINVDRGYVHSTGHFEFIDGIFDLVEAANSSGFRVVVITNQAGIGRGYYSEEQFHELTAWMCAQFRMRGTQIDRVYFSPYHPAEGIGDYRKVEDTRKPGPGMILRARCDLDVLLEESILVGDKPSDIKAGIAAGVRTNILLSGDAFPELAGLDYQLVQTLEDVIPYLLASVGGASLR